MDAMRLAAVVRAVRSTSWRSIRWRTLLVVELKTEVVDVQALEARVDRYRPTDAPMAA